MQDLGTCSIACKSYLHSKSKSKAKKNSCKILRKVCLLFVLYIHFVSITYRTYSSDCLSSFETVNIAQVILVTIFVFQPVEIKTFIMYCVFCLKKNWIEDLHQEFPFLALRSSNPSHKRLYIKGTQHFNINLG